MDWANLANAIEYETMFQNAKTKAFIETTHFLINREDFYWEFIARPFTRSHGANC